MSGDPADGVPERRDRPPHAPRHAGDAGVELAGLKVLVVEDEAVVAMLVAEYLDDLGCEVAGVASRLEEAQELARKLALDVAVLDVDLAGRTSCPVAALLRGRGLPFVVATGYDGADLPEGLRTAPLLAKPFRLEELARALGAASRR